MQEKIYLETDDEITSVIDKIKKTNSNNVEVVVPKRATLIQSIVNLKLLQRQSILINKKVTLFINDEKGQNLAKKAGLNVKGSNASGNKAEEQDLKTKEDQDIYNEKEEPLINTKKNDKKNIYKSKDRLDFWGKFKTSGKKDQNIFSGVTKNIQSIGGNGDNQEKDNINPTKKNIDFNKYFNVKRNDKVHLLPTVNLRSFLIFFGISILVIMLIFVMVLPTAKILIQPKTEPFSTSFDIVISNTVQNLDIDNLIIPGQTISHEEQSENMQFNATGEKIVGEKARGTITVYNSYSSNPVTLLASTRFVSSGKTYYSLQQITIPGASVDGGVAVPGKTTVRLEAESEGEDFNIGPARFIIPNLSTDRQQDIYGQSTEAFSGGTSQIVKVVSEEDYENAKNELFQSTYGKMVESLSDKVSEGKILAVGIMKKEVAEINSNPGIGEEADKFNMDMKVKVFGYLVNKEDLAVIVNNKFSELVPENKFIINDDIAQGIEFAPLDGVVSDENSTAAKINITKQVAWKLDEAKIKENLIGKSESEAIDYLSSDTNIVNASVDFWPFWVNSVPKSVKKIKISLDIDNNGDIITNN